MSQREKGFHIYFSKDSRTEKIEKMVFVRRHFKKKIKNALRNLYWKHHGGSFVNPSLPSNPKSFLFICSGNVCRSPFAEHVARKVARKREFFSAGMKVSKSNPPPPEAVVAAEEFGVKLDGHRSREITPDMVESFDMVLAMEASQFQGLKKAYSDLSGKIFLLPFYEEAPDKKGNWFYRYNIEDPYGKSLEAFQNCFRRIEICIQGLFRTMEKIEDGSRGEI